MDEAVVNLHMHTRYSDGFGSHQEIAAAALRARVDCVIVTDHNVLVKGVQRFYERGEGRVLLLAGEEIHDRSRMPQRNHLLVFGCAEELAALGHDTVALMRAVHGKGALSFVAHPVDPAAPAFREPDISWTSQPPDDATGIELWNGLSELKAHVPTRLHGLLYAFLPHLVAHGPLPAALELWDRLLSQRPTVAIGGSDAHALRLRMGPLRRTVFPYEFHFRAINTHVLLESPMGNDASRAAGAILGALKSGRCFIGYDLPGDTRGFQFTASRPGVEAMIGDHIQIDDDLILQAKLPKDAEVRLLRNGELVESATLTKTLAHRVRRPGVYRLEAYRRYLGRRRTWILSNPIYIEAGRV